MGTALRLRCSIWISNKSAALRVCGCKKKPPPWRRQGNRCTLLEEIMKKCNYDVCVDPWMSSWCFSELCIMFMHYPLKIHTGIWGREWDEGIGQGHNLLNTRFQQLKFPEKPFPSGDNTTWSLLSLNLMKAPVGSSISTWHHKFRQGAHVTTASQWQDMHTVSKPWIKP